MQSVDANADDADVAVADGDDACVGDADVGLLMRSVGAGGEVVDGANARDDDADDDAGKVADGGDPCDDESDAGSLMQSVDDVGGFVNGANAHNDDANAVGMGSGARPRRLPILILLCVADIDKASWYVEEQLNR